MTIHAMFKPGQKGTRKLVGKYGSQLVAVRYRYDNNTHKHIKTVELIIDEKKWDNPKSAHPPLPIKSLSIKGE